MQKHILMKWFHNIFYLYWNSWIIMNDNHIAIRQLNLLKSGLVCVINEKENK